LQDAKRRDHDRQANGGASKRRGVCRWTLIEDMVWDEGVYRSAQQCKVKWEKLTGEFRKVLDYEKNIPPGRDSYWHITSVDRKDAKLPPNFHKSLYDALMQWYGRSRAVNPGNLILDSGIPETSTPGGGSSFSPSRDTDEPDESNPSPETPNTMKKRKRPPRGVDSLVAILERGFEAHRQVMLDCEERRDVRHREVLEANRQALDRQLESQERVATGYTTVFLGVADALREVARRFS